MFLEPSACSFPLLVSLPTNEQGTVQVPLSLRKVDQALRPR